MGFRVFAVLLSLLALFGIAIAQVPDSDTFRYVNEGDFGEFVTEYGASYRPTGIFGAPFQLMWYNVTPGQYFVGLRMGLSRSESLFRWVWDANRGRPVGEGATLSFGKDGNLVLAEADGNVVWSTGTANKGVVGLKLLPTGNLVLHDKNGKFVWQSFNFPTDTLLVGQTLSIAGPNKIVSRRAENDNSDGIYSFVLDPSTGLNLYAAASPKPLVYSNDRFSGPKGVQQVTFESDPVNDGAAYNLQINSPTGGTIILTRPKYNATLSFLRIAVDGNLEIYTYNDIVDYGAWERTYAFFSTRNGELPECSLPSKCGPLGLCKNDMCVACPTSKGNEGWSESCVPAGPWSNCAPDMKFGAQYYKVVGVESFIPLYNKGQKKVKLDECKKTCTNDCSCLGVFYWEESSTCWMAPVLGSLSSVPTTSHVAYIKNVTSVVRVGMRAVPLLSILE